MISNIEKYKKDLKKLIEDGDQLLNAMHFSFTKDQFEDLLTKEMKDKSKISEFINRLPNFHTDYQIWYSEALILVKQLLPDRFSDFVKQYEKPTVKRKDITYENYVIEDALQGLYITKGWEKEKVVGADAAIPRFQQQLNIIKSVKTRFESSLFDIKLLVQADLFDSELDAARELLKNKFGRPAGAMAGVVLEKHLNQVCENHMIIIIKKNPSISDFNDLLKEKGVIDIPQWRFIQHLGDLRNLCDHDKKKEPANEQIEDLIAGVDKTTKTVF